MGNKIVKQKKKTLHTLDFILQTNQDLEINYNFFSTVQQPQQKLNLLLQNQTKKDNYIKMENKTRTYNWFDFMSELVPNWWLVTEIYFFLICEAAT